MRILLLTILLLNIYLLANNAQKQDKRVKENIKKQIELENKYSKEQKFYQGKNYNLKQHEIDQKVVDSIPKQREIDYDFDMNDVYD